MGEKKHSETNIQQGELMSKEGKQGFFSDFKRIFSLYLTNFSYKLPDEHNWKKDALFIVKIKLTNYFLLEISCSTCSYYKL